MRVVNRFPLLTRTLVFVLLPLAAILIWVIQSVFYKPLPALATEVLMQGVTEPVSIRRDVQGITHISASNDRDVFFATGYSHAQDRLWQLEWQRRLSQGRLSEVFGKSTAKQDVWVRTLGIEKAAVEAEKQLSQLARESLKAYADGINAYLAQASDLPVEFTMFGIQPEPWQVTDSLAWVKMFALNLAGNYRLELQNQIAMTHLEKHQIEELYGDFFSSQLAHNIDMSKDVTALQSLYSRQLESENKFKNGGEFVGSNAWVVSGEHTLSGKAILANDPHLGLQIPSFWYGITQKGQYLEAQGASLVGLPLVIFGRNQFIAWGGTNMMADAQDLFSEVLDPANGNAYLRDNVPQTFETRTEQVLVRADFPSQLRPELKPLTIHIRESDLGPVISDVVDGFEQPLALRWTGLDSDDTSYDAFFAMNYAKDWQEFNAALSQLVAPAMNFVYADKDNNIGMVAAGRVPVRGQGNGSLPIIAQHTKNHWHGSLPFEDMPRYFNPEQGFLVNANNDNTPSDYPHLISSSFASDYRAKRISQVLEQYIDGGQKMNMTDMQLLQSDVLDLSVDQLKQYLQTLNAQTELQRKAVELITAWNGVANSESVSASIFYGWTRHLRNALLVDELGGYWNRPEQHEYLRGISGSVSSDSLARLLKSDSTFCDNQRTPEVETCQDTALRALDRSIQELIKLAGDDMDNWQWGKLQNTLYAHLPLSEVKFLNRLFERRVSAGGAPNTVNVAVSRFDEDDGYVQNFGAGFRQIIAMNDKDMTYWFMNSTGQSGQLASQYYDNMLTEFNKVEFIELSADSASRSTTLLQPKSLQGDN